MSTAIDTNVLVALWNADHSLNSVARRGLEAAQAEGRLVVSAPVFAELMAARSRNEEFLASFFDDARMQVDWELTEATWRAAGSAFRGYVERRRKQRDTGARRIPTDFLVGAHALTGGHALLTLDAGLYRSVFPRLKIISI
jgi:predicted nucleic acid-binding protein